MGAKGALAFLLVAVCTTPALAQTDLMGTWRPLPRNQDGSGMTGDIAAMCLYAGMGCGRITDIPTAAEVIARLMQEYQAICDGKDANLSQESGKPLDS